MPLPPPPIEDNQDQWQIKGRKGGRAPQASMSQKRGKKQYFKTATNKTEKRLTYQQALSVRGVHSTTPVRGKKTPQQYFRQSRPPKVRPTLLRVADLHTGRNQYM